MNNKEFSLIIICILYFCKSYTQTIETIYLNPKDSTSSYYTIVHPINKSSNKYCLLLPGYQEAAGHIFYNSDIANEFSKNNFTVIIPTLAEGRESLGIDSLSQQSLFEIHKDAIARLNLKNQNLVLGGFSLGGTTIIKYVQNYNLKPRAIFAIDPPLDFERFYNSAKSQGQINPNTLVGKIIDRYDTPEKSINKYKSISPYLHSQVDVKNLLKFNETPIRIYSEPDINWYINERLQSIYDMNVIDISAFIKELRSIGNKEAELIISINKGFRKPNNIRHPHSWSIVDNQDLLNWIIKKIEK